MVYEKTFNQGLYKLTSFLIEKRRYLVRTSKDALLADIKVYMQKYVGAK